MFVKVTLDPSELRTGDIVALHADVVGELEDDVGDFKDETGHAQLDFIGGMISFLKPGFPVIFIRPDHAAEARTIWEYINNGWLTLNSKESYP